MATKVGNDDSDLEYLMDAVTPIIKQTKTYQKEKTDMNKEQFIKTKTAHKAEIKKLKQDIKRHKLLLKQSKIMFKLGQMKES